MIYTNTKERPRYASIEEEQKQMARDYGSRYDTEDHTSIEKRRMSNQRACLAITMFRHGLNAKEIKEIIDESYFLNLDCKEKHLDPYTLLVTEVGLDKV